MENNRCRASAFHFPFFRKGKTCRWSEEKCVPSAVVAFQQRTCWARLSEMSSSGMVGGCYPRYEFTRLTDADRREQFSTFELYRACKRRCCDIMESLPFPVGESLPLCVRPPKLWRFSSRAFLFSSFWGVREASDGIRSFRFNSSASEIIRRWRFARRSLMA